MGTVEKSHKKRKREEVTNGDIDSPVVDGNGTKHKKKKSQSEKPGEESLQTNGDGPQHSPRETDPARKAKKVKASKRAETQAEEEVEDHIDDANERLPDESQELAKDEDEKTQRRREKKLKKEQKKAERHALEIVENKSVRLEIEKTPNDLIVPDSQDLETRKKESTETKRKKKLKEADGEQMLDELDRVPSTDNHKPANNTGSATNASSTKPGKVSAPVSPFITRTSSFYVSLAPVAQKYPLAALCAEHLSPLLLHYSSPLKGIVLSYSNPRLSTIPPETKQQAKHSNRNRVALARSIGEYATPLVWLTADFVIFSPIKGAELEGYVNVQNDTHLGVLCYNYFNASIEQRHLPQSWSFQKSRTNDSDGYFVDEQQDKVDGLVAFRALDFESTSFARDKGGVVTIEGTMRE